MMLCDFPVMYELDIAAVQLSTILTTSNCGLMRHLPCASFESLDSCSSSTFPSIRLYQLYSCVEGPILFASKAPSISPATLRSSVRCVSH